MRATALIAALAIAPGPVSAADGNLAGIYSNLSYNDEAGDLLGVEMMVVPTDSDHYAIFVQCAAGGLPETELTQSVQSGATLSFRMSADLCGRGRYQATVSWKGMRLQYLERKGDPPIFLKRKKSYWE